MYNNTTSTNVLTPSEQIIKKVMAIDILFRRTLLQLESFSNL